MKSRRKKNYLNIRNIFIQITRFEKWFLKLLINMNQKITLSVFGVD